MKRILKTLRKRIKGIPSDKASPDKFFTAIYKHNYWQGQHSRSGTGSEGAFAKQKVILLKKLIKDYDLRSVLDIGCGDFYWMKGVVQHLESYHGVDVVEQVIINNIDAYGTNEVSFQHLDMSNPEGQKKLTIKRCDLVICFDVLGHMLNTEIDNLIRFILYHLDAKFLLVTNRKGTKSELYLQRPKSRHEGINIQQHPLFQAHNLKPIWEEKAQFPGDFFELYDIHAIRNSYS